MKLLLLNYEYPPLGGGAGRAMQSIARQIAAMGHDVDIITSHFEFAYSENVDYDVKVYSVPSLRKGIHDCGIRGAFTYVFFAYFKMLKLFRYKKYDIIHYYFSLPTAFLSLLPGKHRRVPYIISLRGSDVPKYDIYNKKLQFFHRLSLPITKLIWERAKSVTALSNSLKQIALETNPNQIINVIPNGIDTTVFSPVNKYKGNDNKFRLITVARLIKRKGIQNIFKALSEIKGNSISLTIIGEGNYKNELKNLRDNLGLTKCVTFLGVCERDIILSNFWQSDVFILISLAESFGNVFIEAMACGLPIIGPNKGGIPDLVSEENGILVQPDNIQQIKSAILTMKNNREMRIRMGKVNSEKAKEYSWGKIALAYKDIYMKNLNGHDKQN